MRCHAIYRFASAFDNLGLDSFRKSKFISLFCVFTRVKADRPKFLRIRCECERSVRVLPHLASLAWPSSVLHLATISKYSALWCALSAFVQHHIFRPKETVFYVKLVRLMKRPWFKCCWIVWLATPCQFLGMSNRLFQMMWPSAVVPITRLIFN